MDEATKLARSFYKNYLRGSNYFPYEAITNLLQMNNITVTNWDFRVDKFSGMLLFDEDEDDYMIVVNKNHNPRRRLFTIAHELGHFYLHRDTQNEFFCNEMFKECFPAMECEANAFAAELLMPENIVLHLLKQNLSLSRIATQLGVSYEAIKWRYVNLCEIHLDDFNYEKKQELIKMLFNDDNPGFGRRILI